MRPYFVHLSSGAILDISVFVYYYKDAMSHDFRIVCCSRGVTSPVTLRYLVEEDRDQDYNDIILATQEYNLYEFSNRRKGSKPEE